MEIFVLGEKGWIGKAVQMDIPNSIPSRLSSGITQSDFRSWLSAQKLGCYINCIGKTAGTSGEMEWANVGIEEELVSHARRTGSRIIQLGSAADYGHSMKSFIP